MSFTFTFIVVIITIIVAYDVHFCAGVHVAVYAGNFGSCSGGYDDSSRGHAPGD